MTCKPVSIIRPIPTHGEPGAFGTIRKYDIHCGIDLYCENRTPVYAIEDGIVVGFEMFTGPYAGSPWWNETWAILVKGESGVIVYGEVDPLIETCSIGNSVKRGEKIAEVIPVLKKDKGVTPTSMLHLELHTLESKSTFWWNHNEPQPEELLDPTELIRKVYAAD